MMYYGTGRKLVTDVPLVHSARDSFRLFKEQSETIADFLDFVERFGINVQPLLVEIEKLEPMVQQAKQNYISQEYESAVNVMTEAMGSLNLISERGAKLRRRTLTWIYVIEWLTVTATGLISGLVVYYLMMKRKLYREARVTRFAEPLH